MRCQNARGVLLPMGGRVTQQGLEGLSSSQQRAAAGALGHGSGDGAPPGRASLGLGGDSAGAAGDGGLVEGDDASTALPGAPFAFSQARRSRGRAEGERPSRVWASSCGCLEGRRAQLPCCSVWEWTGALCRVGSERVCVRAWSCGRRHALPAAGGPHGAHPVHGGGRRQRAAIHGQRGLHHQGEGEG